MSKLQVQWSMKTFNVSASYELSYCLYHPSNICPFHNQSFQNLNIQVVEGFNSFFIEQTFRVLHFGIEAAVAEFIFQQFHFKHCARCGKLVVQFDQFMGQGVHFISVDA